MTIAVDRNGLFDVLLDDPSYGQLATEAIRAAIQAGPVVVWPVVYAELAPRFEKDDLDRFLADLTIRIEPFERPALRVASRAWQAYAARRGQQV